MPKSTVLDHSTCSRPIRFMRVRICALPFLMLVLQRSSICCVAWLVLPVLRGAEIQLAPVDQPLELIALHHKKAWVENLRCKKQAQALSSVALAWFLGCKWACQPGKGSFILCM
jgi:hypothetical protein